MALRVVGLIRAPEGIQLRYPAREGRVWTRGRSIVKARIGNGYYLAVALIGSPVHHNVGVQYLPCNRIVELNLRHLLNYTHCVDRGEVVEEFFLHSEPNLPAAHGQCVLVDSRGVRDRGTQSVRLGVNVPVEDNVHGAGGPRVRRRGGCGQDARGWGHSRRLQVGRDLETLQIDIRPGHEWQGSDARQVGSLVAAQVGVFRHILLDDDAQLRQLVRLVRRERRGRLDQDVVGCGGIRRLESGETERLGVRDRIERNPVDRNKCHVDPPFEIVDCTEYMLMICDEFAMNFVQLTGNLLAKSSFTSGSSWCQLHPGEDYAG